MDTLINKIDWQTNCADLKSRGKVILDCKHWSDCKFLVGIESHQKLFSGHKLILAMSSPVFERMFYGNFPDTDNNPILVPDITTAAFDSMMAYIYTDTITIYSFEHACELYYAGKKYILPQILLQCITYLLQNLNPTNVCDAYEFSRLFSEAPLENRCLQMFSQRTKEIINHENFMKIELSTLMAIFNLDKLNIQTELDLIKVLNDYGIHNGYISQPSEKEKVIFHNRSDEEKSSPIVLINDNRNENENKRENNSYKELQVDERLYAKRSIIDLKEAIKKIRFLSLSPQQFSEVPEKYNLLTESEALSIVLNIVSTNNTYPLPEGFSTSRNRRQQYRTLDTFSMSHMVSGIQSNPEVDLIQKRVISIPRTRRVISTFQHS